MGTKSNKTGNILNKSWKLHALISRKCIVDMLHMLTLHIFLKYS